MIITDLELLQKPAEPLQFLTDAGTNREEGDEIVAKLKDTIEKENLRTLAAPQIGINKRIFCIKFDDQIKTFINPIITEKSGSILGVETFNSMPGKEILIARPEEITVVYYTDDFKYEDNKLLGQAARIFDQQAQLLDGILPDAFGLISDIEQDGSLQDLTEEEFNELVDIYKQFIAAKTKAYKDVLSEEEKVVYNKLRFDEDVINGRSEVVEDDRAIRAQQNKLLRAQNQINKERNKKALNNFLRRKKK